MMLTFPFFPFSCIPPTHVSSKLREQERKETTREEAEEKQEQVISLVIKAIYVDQIK